MKNFILVLVIVCLSTKSEAQIESGKILKVIDVNLGVGDYHQTTPLRLDFRYARVLKNNLAVGGRIDIQSDYAQDGDLYSMYSLGPEVRYYMPMGNSYLFTGLSALAGYHEGWEGFMTTITPEIGVTYFITNNMAIEPKLNYSLRHTSSTWSGYKQEIKINESVNTLNLAIGFQFYFNRIKFDLGNLLK